MDTAIIDVTTETPEAATACEAATPPAPLVHIGNFSGARGLRLSPLSVRIDAPAHVAAMERLKDQLAAEEALESEECYLSGRISRCVGLGLFAVSAPAGVVQQFLGYFPTVMMAQRAIRTFETAAGLGPTRRSHSKKLVEPVRDRERGDSTP